MPASTVKKAHLAKCQRCRRATFLRRELRDVVFKDHPMKPWFRCMLGCDRATLRQWLQDHFEPWMTWENYGAKRGCWTIGHRRPCASFALGVFSEDCKAFHHTNLHPQDFIENSRLGARMPDCAASPVD